LPRQRIGAESPRESGAQVGQPGAFQNGQQPPVLDGVQQDDTLERRIAAGKLRMDLDRIGRNAGNGSRRQQHGAGAFGRRGRQRNGITVPGRRAFARDGHEPLAQGVQDDRRCHRLGDFGTRQDKRHTVPPARRRARRPGFLFSMHWLSPVPVLSFSKS